MKLAESNGFVYSLNNGYVYTTSKSTGKTALFGDLAYYKMMLLNPSFSSGLLEQQK